MWSFLPRSAGSWPALFAADCDVNKILTIEASGIGIACVTAQYFHCPVVFAKKSQTKNIAGEVYTTKVESFTHGRVYDVIVAKQFLGPEDRVLIIDDFLANGAALEGLIRPGTDQAGAIPGGGRHCRGKGVSARRRPHPRPGASGWSPWPGLSPWERTALSLADDAAVED